ncbi:autotransporter domain-containing protein [uncultured Tateyamaria sp.]|uniref:DUF7933 domain-containing protein n=1 Tax=uncultured Tateyamaria sp. TaxID=455651 RepID=UPI00262C0A8A|nr:autotransporter domain-containing protein [uncultured Tateyamaria sp.]
MTFFRTYFSALLMFLVLAAVGQQAHAQAPASLSFEATPTTIGAGGSTTLTFTIDNSFGLDIADAAFSMVLPVSPGQAVVADNLASTTCIGGTITAASGATSIAFADGVLDRGTTCTVSVSVTLPVAGSYSFPATTVTSSGGTQPPGSPVNVTAVAPTSGLASFDFVLSDASIDQGGVTTAIYTIANTSTDTATSNANRMGSFSFDHTLPPGVAIATPSNSSTTCEPTGFGSPFIAALDGGQEISFSLSGSNFSDLFATLLPGESCTVSVDLVGNVIGGYQLTPDPLSAAPETVPAATRSLTVNEIIIPTDEVTITKTFATETVAPGGMVDLTFLLGNANATEDATQVSFTDDIDAFINGAILVGLPSNDVCGIGSMVSGTSTLTLSGGTIPARSTCSFTVSVQVPASTVAGDYLNTTSAVQAQIGSGPVGGTNTGSDTLTVLAAQPLTLTRAFTPDAVGAGDPLVLTYTIFNPNASLTATAIAFSEDFSSRLGNLAAFTGMTAACGAGSGSTNLIVSDFTGSSLVGFNFFGGELAPGAFCTFSATSTVPTDSPSGAFVSTSSDLTATFSGQTVTTPGQSDTLTVNAGATVTLSATVEDTIDGINDDRVVNGGQFDVVLTFENAAESQVGITAGGYEFDVAQFGAGTTAALVSNGCTGAGASFNGGGNLLTVTDVALAIGASCDISVRVTAQGGTNVLASADTSPLTFTAGGAPGQAAGTTASITIGNALPLVASHAFNGGATALAGETIRLSYLFENPNATLDANNLVFTHNLAGVVGGLSNVSVTPAVDTCNFALVNGTTFLIATGGTVPAGSSCEVAIDVLVPVSVGTGDFFSQTSDLSATIDSATLITSGSQAVLTVDNEPIGFSMAFTDDPVAPGEDVTLEFTIENPLSTALSAIAFDLDLNTAIGTPVFASTLATNTCGGTDSTAGTGTLTYGAGTLAANSTCTIIVAATIPAGSNNGNFAHTTSGLTATAGAISVGADPASDTLVVNSLADVIFSAAISPASTVLGGTTAITYTIENAGTTTISDLVFSHDIGGTLQNTVATNLPLANACGAGSSVSGTDTVGLTGGEVGPGETCNIVVDLAVPVTATASTTPYATATGDLFSNGLAIAGPASTALTIAAAADLAVTVDNGATSIVAGESTVHTITVSNNGPSDDPAAVFQGVPFPFASCTYTSVASGGASGNTAAGSGPPGNTLNLPNGSSVTYTLTCAAPTNLGGTATTSATVTTSAGVTSLVPGNDSASDSDPVLRVVDLGVTLADSVDPVLPNGTTTYTAVVSNAGPSLETDARATFTLPTGFSLASTSGCTQDPSGVPTCSLGFIQPGTSKTFTVQTTADAATTGTQMASVSVASFSGGTDPVTSNDSATQETTVTPQADISVSVSDGVTTVEAGRRTNYEILVRNDGPSLAPAVTLTDSFPAGLVCNVTSQAIGGVTGNTDQSNVTGLIETLSMPSGSFVSYTARCLVPTSATGTLSNTATVSSSIGDPVAANNSATDNDTVITQESDLSIALRAPQAGYFAGDTFTMSGTVSNSGPSDAPNTSVAITLPAGLTFVSTSGCAEDPNGVPTCSVGTVTPTATNRFDLTVSVDGDAGANLTTTALVSSDATDLNTANNTGTSSVAITPLVDVSVTTTDGVSAVAAGDTVTYTTVVSNAGPSTDPSVSFTDSFPANLTCGYTSVATGGATGNTVSGTGNPSETLNLPNGSTVTYTAVCTVPSSLAPQILSSTATVTPSVFETVTSNNTATDDDTSVVTSVDLSVSVSQGTNPLFVGETNTYTVTINNAGPSDAPSIFAGASAGPGLDFGVLSGCTASSSPVPPGLFACDIPTLIAGQQASFTFTATANGDLTGSVSASAFGFVVDGDEVDAADNTFDATTTVVPRADLSVTKSDGVTSAAAGETVTYTIVASNAGPSPDPAAALTDTFASGLTCTYTSVAAGGATGNTAAGSGDLSETLSLPVDASVTYTASCLIGTTETGTLSNTATIAASIADPDTANNTATDNDTVLQQVADLNVTLADTPDPVNAASNISYSVDVTNDGPSQAANAVATFTLDGGLSLVSTTGCTEDPNGVTTCSLGAIALNDTASFTVVASGTDDEAGDVTSSVSVASDATDPITTDNIAQATTTVTQVADIAVVISDGLTSALAGNNITYTLNVANFGPSTDPAVRIVDTFDPNTTCTFSPVFLNGGSLVSSTTVAGGFDQTVSLPSGGRAFYNVSCTIDGDFEGTLTNSVVATGSVIDPVASNNAAADSDTVVTRSTDLSVTNSDGITLITSGQSLTYKIVVRNFGPSDEPAATFTDSFPTGLTCTYTSTAEGGATGNTASGSGNLTETLAMPKGSSVTYLASCLVDPNATGTLSNTASVTASGFDRYTGNNTAAAADTTITPLTFGFTKSFNPTAVDVGQTSRLTLVVDNTTNSLASTGMSFDDPLPTGMVLAADPAASNSCGGALTATAGASSVSLSGGTVAGGATCSIAVTVVTSADGSLANTTTVLASNFPDAGPAVANLAVNPAGAPTFVKGFADTSVNQGETTVLTFGIDNTANSVPATGMAFTDTLPAGMVVANSPSVSNGCGGTFTATQQAGSVSLSGGTVAALESCTIDVTVRATGFGTLLNTAGDLTSDLPTATGPSATLTSVAAEMTFAKFYTPNSIAQGQNSTIFYLIENTNSAINATDVSFTDNLTGGLIVATPANVNNGCGGTFTADPGSAAIVLSNGEVGQFSSCVITVDVTAPDAGSITHSTSEITSTVATTPAATATLNVSAAFAQGFLQSFVPASITQGETSVLTFDISNDNFIAVEGLAFTDTLPSGVTVAAIPAASNTCGGTFAPSAGDGTLIFSGGALAARSACAISVTVRAVEDGSAINTSGPLTSTTVPDSDASVATLTVGAADAPAFTKVFTPDAVEQGDTSDLTYTIDNSANAIQAGELAFTDSFPEGLVATSVAITNTCGGTVTTATDGTLLTLAGGTVAEGASCTITANVRVLSASDIISVSGDLTSELETASGASAGIEVTRAGAPVFAQSFTPSTIAQGEVSTLTFDIDNTANLIEAVNAAFTNTLPDGLIIADPSNVSNACGGTLSFSTGGSILDFSNGVIAEGTSCAISVDVRALVSGAIENTTSDLTSSITTALAASATLTVEAAEAPGFAKVFAPDAIAQGETSVLTFTIDNGANAILADSVAFSDTFPDGLVLAETPAASNTCGGTLTASGGAGDMSLENGSIAAGDACEISVTVRALGSGVMENVTSDLTSTIATADPATATLTVTAADAPTFAKAFSPDTVAQGETSTLIFTIDNSANAILMESIAFDDVYPEGILTADDPNISNTCGGTFTTVAGGVSASLLDGVLAEGASCTISVDVRAIGVGALENTTTELTSTLATAPAASATLTSTAADAPGFAKSFSPAAIVQGEVSTLTISIDNTANAILADELAMTDVFPSGMIVAPTASLTNTCGGTATAVSGSDTLTLSDGVLAEGSTCEITVSVRAIETGSLVNVTSDLISTIATASAATATLTVSTADAPGFAISFAPDSIAQGQTTTLSFVIDNTGNAIEATSLAFDNTLPTDVTIAETPAISDSCGGTLTAVAGASSLSFVGGTVAEGASCEVTVDVQAIGTGAVTNTASTLTSSLPTAAAPSATLTVTEAEAPGFTKVFGNTLLSQGATTTLVYTIDNTANSIGATGLGFTDNLPAGLELVSSTLTGNSCGGNLTAAAGSQSISLSGGTLGAGETCQITLVVRALTSGSFSNGAPVLTSSLPTATADLPGGSVVVIEELPLTASLVFSPSSIEQDEVSTLTYTLTNPAALAATSITLNDTLPSGVSIASVANASTTCSGTLSATAGGSSVALSGANLGVGSSCSISVNVTSLTIGSFANSLDTLTSSLGTSDTASATLQITPATTGTVTFVQVTDTDGSYSFSSVEPGLNFSILASGGSGTAGPIRVDAGSYLVNQSVPDGVGNTSISCSDGDSTGDAFARTLSLNIAPLEAVTCTISSISTRQQTVDVINEFLTKRADLILSSEPSAGRRFDRLKRGSGTSSPLQFSQGDLKSFLPFSATMDFGGGNFSFSSSLLQTRQAAASLALAHGSPEDTLYVENQRRDFWVEAQYKEFDLGDNGTGHFGIIYAGVDYLVTPDMLVGVMLQFDDMEDASSATNSTVSGTGWMVGPYMTMRLNDRLYFDGRIAVGQSNNTVSPFNTYSDDFDTNRWLVKAALTGEFTRGAWTIRPNASLSYYEEKQLGYTDSLNVAIPSQTVKLGQLKIGPTFTGNFNTLDGTNYSPYFGLDAIYNYGDTTGVTLSDPDGTAAVEGLRGRIRAGVKISNDRGSEFSFGASYDGIGQSDYENWGVSVELAIPINK